MSRFSERMGLRSPKSIIQIAEMDMDLRNGLWNALFTFYWSKIRYDWIDENNSEIVIILKVIWADYFKFALDEMPSIKDNYLEKIKEYFYDSEWYDVYEFIEFVRNIDHPLGVDVVSYHFEEFCNLVLQKELSGFRFINKTLTPISSDAEVESIGLALSVNNKLLPVKIHINTALQLLSDKKNPDYRNSIKESISAVESLCAIITGDSKSTLGQALKIIENKHGLHPAFKSSLSSLYGYTSDASGIRHALLSESNLNQDDAIYMLVVCSAFVNFLIKKI